MDRTQVLNDRVGSALYRLASLKQRVALPTGAARAIPKLLQEIEALTGELERAFLDLRASRAEYTGAKDAAATACRRAQILFELTPVPMVVVTAEGLIAEANDAAAELFNVSRRHLLGKALYLFVAGDRTEFLKKVHNLETDQPEQWEASFRPRERSAVQVTITGVLDPNGQPLLLLRRVEA